MPRSNSEYGPRSAWRPHPIHWLPYQIWPLRNFQIPFIQSLDSHGIRARTGSRQRQVWKQSHSPRLGASRMSQLYVAVLAIIVAVLLSVAIYRATRVKTKADYLVAGRSLPAMVLVLTL